MKISGVITPEVIKKKLNKIKSKDTDKVKKELQSVYDELRKNILRITEKDKNAFGDLFKRFGSKEFAKNLDLQYWGSLVEKAQDLELIKKYFPLIGEPDRVKSSFISAAQDLARFDCLFQNKLEKGVYKPVLNEEEIKQIAMDSVRNSVKNKDYRNAFGKLYYNGYSSSFPQDELKQLVETTIEQTTSGFNLYSDIKLNFVLDLIGFPSSDDGSAGEVDLAYYIFNNAEYQKFISNDLAEKIVTLKVFNKICLGDFDTASKIKEKHSTMYNASFLRPLIFILTEFIKEPDSSTPAVEFDLYNDKYLTRALRSDFKDVFRNQITPEKINQLAPLVANAESKPRTIGELHKAFNEVEKTFYILLGLENIKELLSDKEYIKVVGEEKIQAVFKERINDALESGKAHAVYNLMFGVALKKDVRIEGVNELQKFLPIEKSELLEKMIDVIDYDAKYLLSKEYDFQFDNLPFDTSGIDNAFELYEQLRDSGAKLPKEEKLKKLIFLKIAINLKEGYEGKGMKTIVDIYENPTNKPYINPQQIKKLLTKVFNEYFDKNLLSSYTNPDYLTYFQTLVNSSLGNLVKNDKRLNTHFQLASFIKDGKYDA